MRAFEFRRRAPTRSASTVLVWWTVARDLTRLAFWLVYRLRCVGRAHVPRTGPVIFAANHQSLFDPPVVGCLVADRPFSPMARVGLFSSKAFGWLIRRFGSIPLHRGRADTAAMRAAIAELKGGGCVLVFPEGSRSPDGAVGRFRPGMLLLVRRTKAPVLPVAVEGAHDLWPLGRRHPKLKGRMMVRAGPVITAQELLRDDPEVAMERLRRTIDAMRLELRRELRQATRGRYPAPGAGDEPCEDL